MLFMLLKGSTIMTAGDVGTGSSECGLIGDDKSQKGVSGWPRIPSRDANDNLLKVEAVTKELQEVEQHIAERRVRRRNGRNS